jgi:hypothetical protein
MRLALSNQGKNNNKRGTTFRKNPKPALRKSMAYKQKSNFTVQVGSGLYASPRQGNDTLEILYRFVIPAVRDKIKTR